VTHRMMRCEGRSGPPGGCALHCHARRDHVSLSDFRLFGPFFFLHRHYLLLRLPGHRSDRTQPLRDLRIEPLQLSLIAAPLPIATL